MAGTDLSTQLEHPRYPRRPRPPRAPLGLGVLLLHGPQWWRTHWAKTGKVDVEVADALPDGWSDWLRWEEAIGPHLPEHWRETSASTRALLRADQGQLLGFTRIVASRR